MYRSAIGICALAAVLAWTVPQPTLLVAQGACSASYDAAITAITDGAARPHP